MNKLEIMGPEGHREVSWDPEAVEAKEEEALDVIAEAERIVEEALARGNPVFVVADPEQPAKRVENFDWTAERTVIVPRMAGG